MRPVITLFNFSVPRETRDFRNFRSQFHKTQGGFITLGESRFGHIYRKFV